MAKTIEITKFQIAWSLHIILTTFAQMSWAPGVCKMEETQHNNEIFYFAGIFFCQPDIPGLTVLYLSSA